MNPPSLRPTRIATTATALLLMITGGMSDAATKGKKLLIYVMAGQSNMQGHAEVSTLAYLPKTPYLPTAEEWALMTGGITRQVKLAREDSIKAELLKDPVNQSLDKKEFADRLQKAVQAEVDQIRAERYALFKQRQTDPARLARDKELAAIFTPQISDQKVLDAIAALKGVKGDDAKTADEWVKRLGLPTAEHTYIAAYGGVSRAKEPGLAVGRLTTGYGARPSAFGPEYAFGMMMEKALDQPILIIKTAWGGKSLHYDFRPPSAGPYQPTASEQAKLEQWKTQKAAWEKFLASGGDEKSMLQQGEELRGLEKQMQAFQKSIYKLPKEKKAVELEKTAATRERIKQLSSTVVSPPGPMPVHDQAGFYWREMIGFIQKVLADPKAYHPEYDPTAGFEVAGALWFQGFNDQFSPEFYGNYASNMVHYIQDLRKEVKQPKLPFVIGVLGTYAFADEAPKSNVANAQREAARAPELAGTVAAIESWPLTTPEVAVWRFKQEAAATNHAGAAEIERAQSDWLLHGSNLGYHYDGSGRFFIRLGDEFAKSMLQLMGKR